MDNLQLDMWLPLGPDGVTVQTTLATLHKSQVPASECYRNNVAAAADDDDDCVETMLQ